jgi:hypothetical protein
MSLISAMLTAFSLEVRDYLRENESRRVLRLPSLLVDDDSLSSKGLVIDDLDLCASPFPRPVKLADLTLRPSRALYPINEIDFNTDIINRVDVAMQALRKEKVRFVAVEPTPSSMKVFLEQSTPLPPRPSSTTV